MRPARPDHRTPEGRPTFRTHLAALRSPRGATALVAVLCLLVSGLGWGAVHGLDSGLLRSLAHSDRSSTNGDRNILVMGLDSRLDSRGKPLPDDVYQALHAGGSEVGGLNANVLMLVHLPAGGGRATALSIPRDDYVRLRGCPNGQCEGKIKQAYGLAAHAERTRLADAGVTGDEVEARSRDAGRTTQMETVSDFLGGVPVDHFVEVTLGAFYRLAQAVEPIGLCVAEHTVDSFSGADFQPGVHQMDAAQAVAYVRQRRDTGTDTELTDMDRERRQQAFVSAVLHQLSAGGTLTDPRRIDAIMDVARRNVVVDDRLDTQSLIEQAPRLLRDGQSYYTLPIVRFDRDAGGEDINVVDLAAVRRAAWQALNPGSEPPDRQWVEASEIPTSAGAAGPGAAEGEAGAAPDSPAGTEPVAATDDPQPTQLSVLDGSASPCVK